MNAEKLRGMFGGSAKGSVPNLIGGAQPQMAQQVTPTEMPNMAEMMAMLGSMKGPEADMMKGMLEMMQNGDPKVQKQMQGYWKMLNGMAESTPEEYKTFIDS